jgi:hypothetical protein
MDSSMRVRTFAVRATACRAIRGLVVLGGLFFAAWLLGAATPAAADTLPAPDSVIAEVTARLPLSAELPHEPPHERSHEQSPEQGHEKDQEQGSTHDPSQDLSAEKTQQPAPRETPAEQNAKPRNEKTPHATAKRKAARTLQAEKAPTARQAKPKTHTSKAKQNRAQKPPAEPQHDGFPRNDGLPTPDDGLAQPTAGPCGLHGSAQDSAGRHPCARPLTVRPAAIAAPAVRTAADEPSFAPD